MESLTLCVFFAIVATLAHEENTTSTCNTDEDGRPLVCDYNGRSFENPIGYFGENTHSLILKNSESLHLYPETHQNNPYRSLISYQIMDIADLAIEPKSFANLHALRFMHILNNNWTIVKNLTFYNLTKLESLVIANDSVKEVQVDAFRGLVRLDALEITNNQVSQLLPGIFKDLENLTSLLLHHNDLETLEDGVFDGLHERLKTLDLSHNKIKVLKTADLNKLTGLTHLYLGHNRISAVDGNFKADKLGVLYFQNNRLQHIRDDLFVGAKELRGIDLSGNGITELSSAPFKKLRALTYLNLQRNNISDISELKQLKAVATYK